VEKKRNRVSFGRVLARVFLSQGEEEEKEGEKGKMQVGKSYSPA
jgi:hypothetical protein